MKLSPCRPVSVTDALTGKRLRLSALASGALLCTPILGYWHRPTGLTVYVAGTMPAHLRTAAEAGCENEEVLLADLGSGIQEIELEDCRREFRVLPAARMVPLFGAEPDHSLAA